jgi:hypothetical protein
MFQPLRVRKRREGVGNARPALDFVNIIAPAPTYLNLLRQRVGVVRKAFREFDGVRRRNSEGAVADRVEIG